MARLPIPGKDNGTWGGILNGFLDVSHNSDGTLQTTALSKAGAVTSINGRMPTSGALSLATTNLADTNISSPTSNQVLTYDATSHKWVNQTVGSGGSPSGSAGGDLGGTYPNPTVLSTSLSAALPVDQGGTGSITQNFIDLSSSQSAGGVKTFTDKISVEALQVTGGTLVSGNVLTSDSSGNATWQGAQSSNQQTVSLKTASYDLTTSDEVILADATSGSLILTLPTATGNQNLYDIKKIDSSSNTVTIATSDSQTIDGSGTAIIKVQYASVSVVADGSNWYII
jgi:hypothetical protein